MLNGAKQQGVGLVEILISLLIVAAAFVVLVQYHSKVFRESGLVDQQLQAQTLATSKLSELQYYSVVETTAGFTAYDDISGGNSTTTVNGTTYTITWTVTTNTDPDYKSVVVNVTWTDPENAAQSIQLNGIVGKIDSKLTGLVS